VTTYPHERQIEYWVSRAIEEYFDNEGYNVIVLPNSNRAEAKLPYDHLFAGQGIKVFGLQYKRLHEANEDYWSVDIAQFKQISKFNWIYYALPQITSIRQHRNALHLLTITKSSSLKSRIASASASNYRLLKSDLGIASGKVPYFRWGGFVQKLFSCTEGWRPSNADELSSMFQEAHDLLSTLIDLYIVSLTTKLAFRISPFVTDLENIESDFDFGIERQR
jgi:hypothetical protein